MIVETSALVGIICGSVGGGLVAGGFAGYGIYKAIDGCSSKDYEQEYERLDKEASFREKKRQGSLNSTHRRVSKLSEGTMQGIAHNQQRASTALGELETTIGSAKRNQDAGQLAIDETRRENEVIKQLTAELKTKTEQLNKINEEYDSLNTKLADAINKLETALAELDLIKKTIFQVNGEKDYAGQVIDAIKRMKLNNIELKRSLTIQTEKYEKAEQRIGVLTEQLMHAKDTIIKQEKVISNLQNEALETVEKTEQQMQSNLRFF